MKEHILTENPSRFVVFPLKYTDIWEFYKTAEHSFWSAEEIDLAQDLTDWDEKLNDDERQRLIERNQYLQEQRDKYVEELIDKN